VAIRSAQPKIGLCHWGGRLHFAEKLCLRQNFPVGSQGVGSLYLPAEAPGKISAEVCYQKTPRSLTGNRLCGSRGFSSERSVVVALRVHRDLLAGRGERLDPKKRKSVETTCKGKKRWRREGTQRADVARRLPPPRVSRLASLQSARERSRQGSGEAAASYFWGGGTQIPVLTGSRSSGGGGRRKSLGCADSWISSSILRHATKTTKFRRNSRRGEDRGVTDNLARVRDR